MVKDVPDLTDDVVRNGSGYRAYAEGLLETGTVRQGLPRPLGCEFRDGGVNFAVFSRHATQVWLELYTHPEDHEPIEVVGLNPHVNRTGDIWHVWVDGLQPGQLYGYRVDGPYAPEEGHRFNPYRLLIDPYANAITHLDNWDFERAVGSDPTASDTPTRWTEENVAWTPKCVLTDSQFDWQHDERLLHDWSETVIYELHVRGFTNDPSSEVEHAGTYRGLVEKIPYLLWLGVTAVELMPVQEFNEFEVTRTNPETGDSLHNYWGYNPTAFMAPNGFYAAAGSHGQQVLEFKQMVQAFHAAGIEVLLDVVFNHTAEGNQHGPTFSWRGFDNLIYYVLDDDQRQYRDFTGTGNTLKADHPVVRDMILDALRYWVVEMHVDGFRFDLASVLGRDQDGHILADPPLIERIAEDPVLRDVKIIAEAWDAAGAYQVGSFASGRWAEWNGRYRDDVRRFWRGDAGLRGDFASRLAGSSDLFELSGRGPDASINYVTSHDGFTLNDLVSYATKHNWANGEENRDGTDANYSANYGVEGPTDDPSIEAVRTKQVKNFLLTLFVSRGVPMLLAGDEMRRTQQGNNNAYCQDNEISWVDWSLQAEHADLVHFVRELIRFRKSRPALCADTYYHSDEVEWYDCQARTPDWDDPEGRCLALLVPGHDTSDLLLLFNAHTEPRRFTLPDAPQGGGWFRKADTSRSEPDDILADGAEVPLSDSTHYPLEPRSSVILVAPGPSDDEEEASSE
jgi:glycogen operon protein